MEATCIDKAQRLSLDIITTIPQVIIENILCLLPIEEAARTSILSREWRYKWTKVPKLVFFSSTVKEDKYWSIHNEIAKVEPERRKKEMMRSKILWTIHQVLLLHKGQIHEFTLSVDISDSTCYEIDQIILHLLRNHTLKKLKLVFDESGFDKEYSLPMWVFLLNHLTDLYLDYCQLNLTPVFNGFGSLTSLTLKRIRISEKDLLHLLSNCPSLKSLCLMLEDHTCGSANPNMMKILKCVPGIEHLTTWGYYSWVCLDCVPEELPTSLAHLKYICVEEVDFNYDFTFEFFGVMIKCSPNVEKIKMELDCYESDPPGLEECSVILKKYSDVWLEHLNELEIVNFEYYELEVMLVEFILARSPNLKKVVLFETNVYDKEEELDMLKTLFCSPHPPRASPFEIVLKTESRFEVFRGFDDED